MKFLTVLLTTTILPITAQCAVNNAFTASALTESAFHEVELTEIAIVDEFGIEVEPLTVYETTHFSANNNPSSGSMTTEEIINIGRKIWEIIEANKPVVNVQTITANALPSGSQHWTELTSWGSPQVLRFKAKYSNLMGLTVAEAVFRLQFTPGGQYQGKGQYLNNVAVVPEYLDVLWGFTFDASVQVGQILNRGTSANPLAAMELSINWRIRSVMKDIQQTAGFFIQGDGKALQLHQR